ncbi:MAG: acyl-CoA dehydrogenase family protein [Rhodospirillales bacterium]|nr:acyl-CoA dehydrogenase family protein [Rhodospirillales bacterium]
MSAFRFDICRLPPEAEALRQKVRAFFEEELSHMTPLQRADSWDGFDRDFSRKMAAKGWIGLTWPERYGGHERTALERYVVLEEALVAGAPVSAHWIAERQSGPLLLNFGSEEQCHKILPGIAKGELVFCIGMSEPDSGSDLASLRSPAKRSDDGWLLNGAKVWTTNAHEADYMIGLFRTSTDPDNRRGGLSQFLIDMKTPGIAVNPIVDLPGREHFNEVVFEDVHLSHDCLIGTEGEGWDQVTAELAYERSGPERYLSSIQILLALVDELKANPSERGTIAVGELMARLATLRAMSLSLASMLEKGQNPSLEATMVKDLGTGFEQTLPDIAQSLIDLEPDPDSGSDMQMVLSFLIQAVPSFSLRGGTREILRGIIARGLGLR